MSEWTAVRLEDIAANEKSAISKPYGSSMVKDDYRLSGIPVVRGVNLTRGVFHDDDFVFISPELADKIPGAQLGPGDLVITHRGTIGQVSMIPRTPKYQRYVTSTSQVKVRLDPARAVPEFFYYWFCSTLGRRTILEHVSTVGVPGLVQPVATVKHLKVPCPPLETQRGIAGVLSALDDKIAANTKLATAAEALGRALFQNAISRPEAVTIQLRDVAKNVAGKYLAKDDYVSDGPYFIYGSNSIMGRHDKALNQGGFAVLAKIGSYCGNLRWSQRPAWVNNNASAIVPMTDTAPSVLRHALDLIDMAPHKAGTGQPYIRMDSLFSTEITVPSLETSAAIAPVLNDLSELEARSGEENTKLAATRDALLPQLMSGKLRVKDGEKVLEEAGV